MKKHKKPRDIEQTLISRVKEKGFRLTHQRREIIRLLSRSKSHPGAMEILRKVRKIVPRISMSTVYYTLDMMKKEGLIRELEYCDMDNRYEINVSDHINLVCTRCRKITDFTGNVPSFSKAIEKETGFKSASMRFEYYGICRNCAK
jgi:Fur family peroxide stress response transcriptional regulator